MTFDPQSILIWNKFDYNFVEKTHTYYYQNQYTVKYSVIDSNNFSSVIIFKYESSNSITNFASWQ